MLAIKFKSKLSRGDFVTSHYFQVIKNKNSVIVGGRGDSRMLPFRVKPIKGRIRWVSLRPTYPHFCLRL